MPQYHTYLHLLLLLAVNSLSADEMQQSICTSNGYRGLPIQMQNEHTCMVLERVQYDIQGEKIQRDSQFNRILSKLSRLDGRIQRGLSRISNNINPRVTKIRGFPALKDISIARDCNELKMSGLNVSGVYPLKLPNSFVVNVWCDFETAGGGWTVFQRRIDGSVNFTRSWDDYTFGFGNVNTEFWLGNDNIHYLTSTMNYTLRIELKDWKDKLYYAQYNTFRVAGEEDGFRLTAKDYKGTAGDSLRYHNNMKFSTPDKDNDKWWTSCAHKDRSGWWFKACHYSSLNGVFYQKGMGNITPDGVINGIIWYHLKKDRSYSLKQVEMKIKPRIAIMEEKAKADAIRHKARTAKRQKAVKKTPPIEDTL